MLTNIPLIVVTRKCNAYCVETRAYFLNCGFDDPWIGCQGNTRKIKLPGSIRVLSVPYP